MLTIDEFNEGAAAGRNRAFYWFAAGILTVSICMGLAFLILAEFEKPNEIEGVVKKIAVLASVIVLGFVSPFVVIFGGSWLMIRGTRRDGRLICPHCDSLLVGVQHWVIATRNCPKCGKRVVAEPEQ